MYSCEPQFYYIKVGFKGIKIIFVCFLDVIAYQPFNIGRNFKNKSSVYSVECTVFGELYKVMVPLQQNIPEPELYADVVYTFRKNVGKSKIRNNSKRSLNIIKIKCSKIPLIRLPMRGCCLKVKSLVGGLNIEYRIIRKKSFWTVKAALKSGVVLILNVLNCGILRFNMIVMR